MDRNEELTQGFFEKYFPKAPAPIYYDREKSADKKVFDYVNNDYFMGYYTENGYAWAEFIVQYPNDHIYEVIKNYAIENGYKWS